MGPTKTKSKSIVRDELPDLESAHFACQGESTIYRLNVQLHRHLYHDLKISDLNLYWDGVYNNVLFCIYQRNCVVSNTCVIVSRFSWQNLQGHLQ